MQISNLKKLSLVAAFAVSSAFVFNGCAAVVVGGAAAGAGAYIGSDSRTVDKQVDDQKIAKNVLSILRNDNTRSDGKVFRVDCVVLNGKRDLEIIILRIRYNLDYRTCCCVNINGT